MDVKTLKMLLGIDGDDTSKDALLTFTLANVEEIIKNYCHVGRVPDGLSHTALRMAVDLYRNEGFGGSDAGSGKATSIKEGDSQVNFGATYDDGFAASLLKTYELQLRRYRRLAGYGN